MIPKKIQIAVARIRSIPNSAHKPYLIIFLEILVWVVSNRGQLNYYLDYELFLKGRQPSDYVKSSLFKRIEKELNSPEYFPILEDKYYFYKALEGNGFRSPNNLFLIDQTGIQKMESNRYISSDEFMQHNFDGFCKAVNGFGGRMIFQVEVKEKRLFLNKKEISVSDFLHYLGKQRYLIQDRILQHDDMKILNPSCINTLRLLTIRTGRTFHYYQGYLRMGINDSYVDNSLSGNIIVGFHRDNGVLMEYANTHENFSSQTSMGKHPQTKTVFKEYQIPYYKESIEMVKSLHQLFQQFFMIGWDIGITPDGPIVIEGNNITTLHAYQVLYGGMKTSFEDLATEYRKNLS